eukprot:781539-Prorocentrum_lima.AAC.1
MVVGNPAFHMATWAATSMDHQEQVQRVVPGEVGQGLPQTAMAAAHMAVTMACKHFPKARTI